MRKAALVLLVISQFSKSAAQLSGLYTVPGSYSTIASAIAGLNAAGAVGGVTFNIAAGYNETAPSGGYSLSATGTPGNPIVFQRSGSGPNPLITAYSGGTGSPGTAVQDGIWRLVGSDHVTIDGIDLMDLNISNNATMEYGFGLFKAGSSNGCQSNIIKNCVITLNRINNASGTGPAVDGSRGINMVNALAGSQNVNLVTTAFAGTNSYNRFYSNTIQNCNVGIAMIGFADVSPFSNADTGNDIGGNSAVTGNSILNFGGGGTANPAAAIRTLAQYDLNISYNVINNNNGAGLNHATVLRGIYLNTAVNANAAIKSNTITLKYGGTTSQASVIENISGASGTTNSITISSNVVTGCTASAITTGAFSGIYNSASAFNLEISNNTFTNNSTNATSGSTYLLRNTGAVSGSLIFSFNNLAMAFTGTAATTGPVYSIYNSNGAASTTLSISSNLFSGYDFVNAPGTGALYMINNTFDCADFSAIHNRCDNLVLNHSGSEYFIYNSSGTHSLLTVSGNTLSNIVRTAPAGNIYGYYATASSPLAGIELISDNLISGITASLAGAGSFYGIYTTEGNALPYPRKTIVNNKVSDIDMNATGTFYGVYAGAMGDGGTTSGSSVLGNTVRNIAFSDLIYGLYLAQPVSTLQALAAHSNTISDLVTNGNSSTAFASYITCSNAGVDFYKNRIYNITANGGTGIAHGLYVASGSTATIFNNCLAAISTPFSTGTNKSNGIYINGGTSVNLFYNTVYLNAVSTGANFGSNALYATSTTTVTLKNNIFINASSPTGQGVAAAFKRNSATLSTYGPGSGNNIFYAGLPSAKHLLFDDGATAIQGIFAFQSLVAPREAGSFSENVPFAGVSGGAFNFLHINPTLFSYASNGAVNITGIPDDYDNNIRQGNTGYSGSGTLPDIGADEYNENLPPCNAASGGTISASAVQTCAGQSVTLMSNGFSTGSGATYQWKVSNVPGGPYTSVTGGNGPGNIVHTSGPLSQGTYYYILAVSCPNSSLSGISSQASVNVVAVPVAVAAASSGSICEGQTFSLSGTANTGSVYLWYGPSGYSASAQNVQLANAGSGADGTYSLLVSGGGCTSQPATVSVSVSGTTLDILSVPASHCGPGTSTLYLISSSATSFSWNSAATTSALVVNPLSTSVYSLTGINANGCVKTVTTGITIVTPTLTPLGGVFCGAGGGLGTVSVNAFSPAAINWYSNPGATVSLGSGTSLTINSPVTTTVYAQANSSVTGSVGATFTGTVLSQGNMFDVFAFSNIIVSGFDIHVPGSSVYTVEIWNRAGNYSGYTSSNTGWTLAGTATLSGNGSGILTPVPLNLSVAISAGSTSAFYITALSGSLNCSGGLPGGGVLTSNSDLQLFAGDGGTYFNVNAGPAAFNGNIHYSAPGCISPLVPVVYKIQPFPAISAIANATLICENDTVNLTGLGAVSYSWSGLGSGNPMAATPTLSTNYTVTGYDSLGCASTATVQVNVLPAPNIVLSQSTPSVCAGATVGIMAAGGLIYNWSTGDTTNSIVVAPVSTTTYTLSGKGINGCTRTRTTVATVYPYPVIVLSPQALTVCENELFTITASGALTYNWNPGNFNSPVLNVIASGLTVFTVTGTNGHCASSTVITVDIDQCLGLKENLETSSIIIYPNPSSQQINMSFSDKGHKEIRILDVQGSEVHISEVDDVTAAVDISGLSKGIYFVNIQTEDNRICRKLIVD
jgi:hypothetical protein